MAVIAGFNARVYISGDATAMTDEACSLWYNGGGDPLDVYRITNSAKRLIDPTATTTVKNNGVLVAAADWELDWLQGRVRPNVTLAGTGFTISSSYLALLEITRAHEWALDKELATQLSTVFKSTSFVERMATLRDASISLSRFDVGGQDYDPGGSSVRLHDLLTAGTTKIVELNFGSSQARIAVKFDKDTNKSAVEDLARSTITGRVTAIAPVGATNFVHEGLSFSDFYTNGYEF